MNGAPRNPRIGLLAGLPSWARPLERERRGTGSMRLAETTVLVLVGVLLAVATVHDLVQQTRVNHRLVADLATWRAATGHRYHNLTVHQDLVTHTTRETVCGNTSPGAPRQRTQLCLLISGPVLHGRRSVRGGYRLAPYAEDVAANRYGCFGQAARRGLCRS